MGLNKELNGVFRDFRASISMILIFISDIQQYQRRRLTKTRLKEKSKPSKIQPPPPTHIPPILGRQGRAWPIDDQFEKDMRMIVGQIEDKSRVSIDKDFIKKYLSSPEGRRAFADAFLNIKHQLFFAEMALIYIISYQEAFLKDYVKAILIHRKNILKSKEKQLTFEEACGFSSIKSLIAHLAQREVDERFYGSIDDADKYIEQRFSLSISQSFKDWEVVREAYYRRNVIVHNRGSTNKLYCSKTGYQKLHHRLQTDIDYANVVGRAVLSLMEFVHKRIFEKLNLRGDKKG